MRRRGLIAYCAGGSLIAGTYVALPSRAEWRLLAAVGLFASMAILVKLLVLLRAQAHEARALEGRTERRRAILDSSLDAVIAIDGAGRITEFSAAAESMFGHRREDVLGRELANLIIPPELRDRHRRGLARAAKSGEGMHIGRRLELSALRADGSRFPVEVAFARASTPKAVEFTGFIRDITERKRAEAELEAAEERYRVLVEQLPLIVYVDEIGPDAANLYTSPQTTEILGYTPEDWRDAPDFFSTILHPDDRERVLEELRRCIASGTPHRSEYRLIARDGRTIWIRDEGVIVRTEDGRPLYWQGYLLDITEQKKATEELERAAFEDPLTRLGNRTWLMRRICEEIAAKGDERGVALVFVDLDDFKTVNDSLGHAAGDELLVALAERLQEVAGEATVARFGGDEFAIFVEHEDVRELAAIAQRAVDAARQPLLVSGHDVRAGVSIGIAVSSASDEALRKPELASFASAELVRNADLAMFAAKKGGGSRYAFFEADMHDVAVKRLAMTAELHRRDIVRELFLEFQPTFDLETASIESVEALVRWRHPVRGIVQPLDFIPLAEETGAIVEIGEWVLNEACAQVARWNSETELARPLVGAVNVSARQLADPGFPKLVERALRRSRLESARLRLELTERAVMTDDRTSVKNLAALRELGVELAIDDFGTGYSSLGYLRQLSVDAIKIDRSFVDSLDTEEDALRLVQGIITLAHSLRLKPIAEGIERTAQVVQLRRLGCNRLQGFLFARPMPPEEVTAMLDEAGGEIPALPRLGSVASGQAVRARSAG